jgi:hypothetical protein
MAGSGAYLFYAGWLFFAGWSTVLVALSVIAFGKDLVPSPERREVRKNRVSYVLLASREFYSPVSTSRHPLTPREDTILHAGARHPYSLKSCTSAC